MNYDAIGLTTHDLQMGLTLIQDLEVAASFPFLSATIVNKDGTPIFTPHTVITRNNLTIGIIGITAETTKENEDYTIIHWKKALDQSLSQLSKVDLMIVLSNLSHEQNEQLAKSYKNIHIILEAGNGSKSQKTTLTSNTLISKTPKEGKYIGELQVDWLPSKQWFLDDRPLIQLKNEIDRLKWFQSRIEKRGGPEKAYKNNPSAKAVYDKKMAQLKALEIELLAKQKIEITNIEYSTFGSTMHPLKPSIHDEPKTTKILKSSRNSTNTLRRKTDISKRFNAYGGSESCKECHEEIYQAYKNTSHSKAYTTLVNKSDNNNPNCIFCHVTGLPERLAYVQPAVPKRLLEVGCESCHGAGQQHIKEPTTYKLQKTVAETTCLVCHTEDHSDDFNYGRDMNLVH